LDNIFTRMIYVSLISFRSRSGELYWACLEGYCCVPRP
jgi:hypothetical protein